jgi:filamentous hemagglutinin family protein
MTLTCPVAVAVLALISPLAQAQIRTDGSVGPAAQNLSGPSYQIPQTLGKLSGGNLFHSFQTFNIGSGQSANFSTSTPGISNVISRVTGGQMSQINGLLSLTAASGTPALFFINPAGVTFGAGASVDVPGAFHVSTANSVKFADGRFNADLNQASTLSSAAPEAFGFLGSTRATLVIQDGAVVQPKPGFPVSVVAGNVGIYDGGTLGARTGEIRVIAVGDAAADIPFSGPLGAEASKANGNLLLSNQGTILSLNRGDAPPGAVSVYAGDVTLSDSGNIRSLNSGGGNAADVQIQASTATLQFEGYVYSSVSGVGSGRGAALDLKIARGLTMTDGASISTDTFARGQAGHVRVQAGQVHIDSAAYIESKTFEDSTGGAGNVQVTAKDLITMSGKNSRIDVTTESSGASGTVQLLARDIALGKGANVFNFAAAGTANAGDVSLNAERSIVLTDAATIISTSIGLGNSGNIALASGGVSLDGNSFISTGATLRGGVSKAGSVMINTTGALDIRNNSFINSGTSSDGDAGSITIRARDVNLDNGRITSFADSGRGNGGIIDVMTTGAVALSNDGSITAGSFSLGNAGSVSISSAQMSLSGGASVSTKSLGDASSAGEVVAGGNAGNIRIDTLGTLAIQGGSISSGTNTTGQGGSVDVSANLILLDGRTSSINAAANLGSTGKAGSLNLRAAETLLLTNGAFISTSNFAQAAPTAELPTSLLSLSASRIGVLSGSAVTTSATGLMSAGNIEVRAGQLSLVGGLMSTDAEQGNGGSIAVRSSLVTLTQSQVTTSVAGESTSTGSPAGFGNGGDIRFDADALVLNTGFIQANTAARSASGGLVKLNVNTLVASGNTLFLGGQTPLEVNPKLFAFNVIQAAAPTGISGAIQVTSPVLDLTGSLARVNAQVLEGVALGRDPCQSTAASSLSIVGRGGLPASSRGLLGAPAASGLAVPASTAATQPAFNTFQPSIQLAQGQTGCVQ